MQNSEEKIVSSRCRFNEHMIRSGLTQKRKLGSFINTLIVYYKRKENNISYTFLSDEDLLSMNTQYLQHDTYTDIITFDLSEKKSNFILADIYISIERVRENARLLDIKYKDELLRVIIHGALHISGFGDKTKKEKEAIRTLEVKWMSKYQRC